MAKSKNEIYNIPFESIAVKENLIFGMILCFIASYFASIGQTIAAYTSSVLKLPILTITAYAMMYGSILASILGLISGPPSFELTFKYCGSLLYLSIIGSVIAGVYYLQLIKNIGSQRAGYIFVLLPIFALIISSFLEQFTLNIHVYIGLGFILFGNYLVMHKSIQQEQNLYKQEQHPLTARN